MRKKQKKRKLMKKRNKNLLMPNKISKFISSKLQSSLFKNSLWGVMSNIFQNILFSVFFIVVARRYTTEDFANYIIANTLYSFVVGFSSLGLGQWFIREMINTDDKHKLIAVNGMPDHIHIFLGLHPAIAISDLVKDVKRASNNWINERGFIKNKFEWQNGYGAFSYGRSQIDHVYKYILDQKKHHAKQSFKTEYITDF